jgi:DNA-binding transcriptional LysR family regulator
MDLKQLTALVTIAETGSVTRAAELLHLVQPAVTRHIRALERELGVVLFERSRHGMRLTPAGDLLLTRARRVLSELERARAELRPDPGSLHGIVTVGLLESMTDLVAEPLVSQVATAHPGIGLRLTTGYSGHLQQWLDEGVLDLTLVYNLRSRPGLNVRPIAREPLWVVGPASVELGVDAVDLSVVGGHPLILPAGGHGLRILIDQAASRANVLLAVATETNSMRVQKQLVLAGHGWTVLPGIGVAEDVAAGRLWGAPLSDAYRDVVLAVPRDVRPRPAVEAVTGILAEQLHAAVESGRWPAATWLRNDD